jgi:hypothetical protein
MFAQSSAPAFAIFRLAARAQEETRERRTKKGTTVMTIRIRHFMFAFLALLGSLFSADRASANVGQALARLEELARIEGELKAIEHELNAFPIRDYYCLPPGAPAKATDQNALQQILNRSNQLSSQATRARSVLVRLITNNQAARSAVDRKIDGGSGVIIDGSYFRSLSDQQRANRAAHNAKLATLNAAPTRRCGGAVQPPRQEIAIIDPLVEVPTSKNFDPIPTPAIPDKFCHEDEKRELMDRLIELRQKALANSAEADALADSLTALQQQVQGNLAATRAKAAKAAHDKDDFALKAHIGQIKKYEASLKILADAIDRANRQEREWLDAESRLDAAYKKVSAMPVVDCTGDELKPANALPGTQFSGVGAAPDLRPVEIPAIPDKVCTEEEKQEIIAKSFTALQNAWHNRDAWNARIEELNGLLKKASGEQRTQLANARDEARRESAKWIRIVKDATDSNNKALALRVEDCGLTETGKTATAFPGVNPGVPEADTLPYDLPNVPEFVCTWDEKQKLVERAEAARAAASHNHRQWSARANALGDLLYGENPVSTGRPQLLRAHSEARAQSDHWATQMLDTAHDVYWKARNLEIRDCGEDKKTSMSTGGAADLNDRLQRARDGQPVYNGGEQQGYGAYGRRGHRFNGDQGFDGSEAENALAETLDDANEHHVHTDECDHPGDNQENGSPAADGWKPSLPNLPAFDDSDNAPKTDSPAGGSTLKDVSTDPHAPTDTKAAPSEPVEPENWRDLQQGGTIVTPKLDGVSLSPAPQDGRQTQSPQGHVIVTPQPSLDRRNVTLAPGAGNVGTSPAQGEWRRVAPPTLVIVPQGGSANDYSGGPLAPNVEQDPKLNTRTSTLPGSQAPVDPDAAAALETGLIGQ